MTFLCFCAVNYFLTNKNSPLILLLQVVFGNGGRIVRQAEKTTVRDYLAIANIKAPPGAVVRKTVETPL